MTEFREILALFVAALLLGSIIAANYNIALVYAQSNGEESSSTTNPSGDSSSTGNSTSTTSNSTSSDPSASTASSNSTSNNSTSPDTSAPLESTVTLEHSEIQINNPVEWVQTVTLSDQADVVAVELPADAQDVSVVTDTGQSVDSSAIVEDPVVADTPVVPLDDVSEVLQDNADTRLVAIEEPATGYDIAYETPAPYTIEDEHFTADLYQKDVTVTHDSALHYSDVQSYSSIPEDLVARGTEFTLNWMVDGVSTDVTSDERFAVTLVDTDGNGIADQMRWIVPQLSEQQFVIEGLILTTNAEHLDANKNFVEDVYDQTKSRDAVWTGEIPSGDYIRVTFEVPLNSTRDITVFARSTYPNSAIEVYEKDSSILLAAFGSIGADAMYKIYLTNLVGSQDTFDLRVIGNPLEIDYIVDPTVTVAPSAVKHFDQWTANTGTKVAAVGTNNMDTSYIISSTVGQRQDFTFASPSTIPVGATINSVTINAVVKKDANPGPFISLYAAKGTGVSDISNGASEDVGNANNYHTISRTMATNPFTSSAWTRSEVLNWQFSSLNDIAFGIKYDSGSTGVRVTQLSVVIDYTPDTTAPTVTLSSSAPEPTNTSPIPFTATFSESVTGFVVGDISVTNGVAGGFAGGPSVYTFSVTPSGQGLVTVNIAAGVAQDTAGNGNTAASPLSRTFDTEPPTITDVLPASSSFINDVSTGGQSDVSYTLSEDVASGTITVANTGAGTLGGGGTCILQGNALDSGAHATFKLTDTTNNCSSDIILNDGGVYTFTFDVTDLAGNPAATVTRTPITFDTTAPVFSAVLPAASSSINSITLSSDVSYTLSETIISGTIRMTRTSGTADPGSHECTLVGTALSSGPHNLFDMSDTTNSCTSAQTLVDGAVYTFRFDDEDAAGNTATAVVRTLVTFDTTAPNTIIDTNPSEPSNSASASFTFHSTEPSSTFECKLDIDPFTACTSPQTYSSLADGSHTFQVRATDAAGNTDGTPASFTWTIITDTTGPSITGLLVSPSLTNVAPTITATATDTQNNVVAAEYFIDFVGADGTGTFMSAADSSFNSLTEGITATLTSPEFTPLSQGSHTIYVHAKDSIGNWGATASTSFVKDTLSPDGTISVSTSLIADATVASPGTFTVTVDYDEAMDIGVYPTIGFTEVVSNTMTLDTATWTDTNTFVFTYTLTDANEEVPATDITVDDGQDVAGNVQLQSSSLAAFSIDTKNPIVLSAVVNHALVTDANDGQTFTVTVTYSEAMDGSSTPSITFSTDVSSTLTLPTGSWLDATHYRFSYTIHDAGVEAPDVGISDISGATDVAGNSQVAFSEADKFDIDTRNPTATIGVNDDKLSEADVGDKKFVVTVTYDESMDTGIAPAIAFENSPLDLSSTLTLDNGAWSDSKTYVAKYDVADANIEGIETDLINIKVSGAKDVVGNIQVVKTTDDLFSIDTKKPVLSLTSVSAWTSGSTVTVTYSQSASDFHLAAGQPVCTPPSGSSFPIGPTTINCTAVDTFGNSISDSFTLNVYKLSGFYQPIDMSGVYNKGKAGNTIPFKFNVYGGTGTAEITDISIFNSIKYKQVTCPSGSQVADEIEVYATGGTSIRYDSSAHQFIYNGQTLKADGGKCFTATLYINTPTGPLATITANLQLTKI